MSATAARLRRVSLSRARAKGLLWEGERHGTMDTELYPEVGNGVR